MSTSFGTQPRGRLEDQRMITGSGRYVSDWRFDGELHAFFARADLAHARIREIDTAAALAMPGVVGVLTGADIIAAGQQPMPAAALRAARSVDSLLSNPAHTPRQA